MRRLSVTMLMLFWASTAGWAQDSAGTRLGADDFLAGPSVVHEADGTDDLFMAGESLRSTSAISGSAHALGRRIEIVEGVGGDVYAAGMEVTLSGAVGGDVSIAGYDLRVTGAVGGDLRAAGANLTLDGPVAGYAALGGDVLRLDAAITGDAHVGAREVTFGPGARIDGALTLYEEVPGTIEVPETVVPAARVSRVKVEDLARDGMPAAFRPFRWQQVVMNFIWGVVMIAVLAALFAAILPAQMAAIRRQILAAPWRALWFGFLTESALAGSVILMAMTLIGLLAMPALILVAILTGVAGYVLGAYALGVGLLLLIGRPEPATAAERALGAAVGALLAGVIGLIPFLGWLFVMALTLAGVGALTLRLFRPQFFVRDLA